MFCRNCGKEILPDAKFCSFCGGLTGDYSKINMQNQMRGVIKFDRSILLHYLSMILSAIIIMLTFSKWINVESWVINTSFSTWGLIEIIGNLSKYVDSKTLSGFAVLLVFLMGTIIFLAGYYISKAYKAGTQAENNDHIIYGYPAMLATAIMCGIFVILLMVISSSNDYDVIKVYFNEKVYYIIAMACLNRFVLLPKMNRIIFDKKQNEAKDSNEEIKEIIS